MRVPGPSRHSELLSLSAPLYISYSNRIVFLYTLAFCRPCATSPAPRYVNFVLVPARSISQSVHPLSHHDHTGDVCKEENKLTDDVLEWPLSHRTDGKSAFGSWTDRHLSRLDETLAPIAPHPPSISGELGSAAREQHRRFERNPGHQGLLVSKARDSGPHVQPCHGHWLDVLRGGRSQAPSQSVERYVFSVSGVSHGWSEFCSSSSTYTSSYWRVKRKDTSRFEKYSLVVFANGGKLPGW